MDDYRTFQRKQSFLHRTFTFDGCMTVSQFWTELGIRMISCVCGAILACILIAVVVPGDTQELIVVANNVVPIFVVVWWLPVIPMTRRRLRDAGYTAKSYLWLLLPGIGTLVFLVRLCAKSVVGQKDRSSDFCDACYYE